jgi:hypothetical protein
MSIETELAALVHADLLGPDDLTFVAGPAAGEPEVKALVDWLAGRGSGPWWRCAEWTDRVRLEAAAGPALPADLGTLVWARWFAEAGDLELWREGAGFRWRFVGDRCTPPPGADDFFAAEDGVAPRLRAGPPTRHLLWRDGEARVATADAETLEYLRGKPRQSAACTLYYDHGAVAAVRYRGLESAPGVPDSRAVNPGISHAE